MERTGGLVLALSANKAATSRTGTRSRSPEELPYRIELWHADGTDTVERVLACALNLQLARAIFKAAVGEYPDRRITVCKGNRIIVDTGVGYLASYKPPDP